MSRASKGQRAKAVETALAVRKRCGLDVPKIGEVGVARREIKGGDQAHEVSVMLVSESGQSIDLKCDLKWSDGAASVVDTFYLAADGNYHSVDGGWVYMVKKDEEKPK